MSTPTPIRYQTLQTQLQATLHEAGARDQCVAGLELAYISKAKNLLRYIPTHRINKELKGAMNWYVNDLAWQANG